MKTRKLLVVAALLTFTIIACKEEETKFGASISPIQNVVNSLPVSMGYFRDEPTIMSTQFKSFKDGRITEFGIRAGKGTYTVSLWDSSAQSIISSTTITATDSTVFKYKDISDINIVSNKTYIIIFGSYYKNTPNATAFPANNFNLNTELINGIADFKFEPKL